MSRPVHLLRPRRSVRTCLFAATVLCLASAASAQVNDIDPAAPPGIFIEPPTAAAPSAINAPPIRPNQPLTTNALIGYVNSEPVFALDIFRPIDDELRQKARDAQSPDKFRADAKRLIRDQIEQYVDESLIVTAAQATLTDSDKQIIEGNMNKATSTILSKYGGGSVAAADKALAGMGSSFQKELVRTRRSLIYYIYKSKNIDPKVVVTRQMVIDAYEKDPTKWQQTGSVELYTITLPVTRWLRQPSTTGKQGPLIEHPTADQIKSAEAQGMAEARDVVMQLKTDKKADFAHLVEDKHSDDKASNRGGRWGNIAKGTLVNTRLEDYAFSLPANTIGDPILFHETDPAKSLIVIVKIGDKKEPRTITFNEAQEQIVKSLTDQQTQELRTEQLTKLYKSGAVEGVDPTTGATFNRMVDVAVDAAVTRYATN